MQILNPAEERAHTMPILSEIAQFIDGYTALRTPRDEHFYETECEGLRFMRADSPGRQIHSVYESSICVTFQGAKEVSTGDRVFAYSPGDYFVVGISMPTLGRITRASPDQPYLGLKLDLDPESLLDTPTTSRPLPISDGADVGVFVGRAGPRVLESVGRIVELLETPEAIPALLPTRLRELYYWLVNGPDGAAFAGIALPDGRVRQVARAIHIMKKEFPAPIRVDDLASEAGMSPSSFHVHFKEVTGMTPIGYYKRLRLLEARRLMTGPHRLTAQDAAFRVGYESPSQFSREYRRIFGAPPGRDRVRSTADS